jgi:membrane protein
VHPLTRRIIDRTPPRVRRGVELVVRTIDGAVADRLPGLAAELAFWVLLSLPALLLTIIAALSLVVGEGGTWQDQLIDRIVEVSTVALTTDAIDRVLRPVLEQLVIGTTVPVVSVAFLATVWTASRAVKVVLVAIAMAYGRSQPAGFGHRLLGFGLTIVGILAGLVLAPVLVVGPGFGEQLDGWLGFDADTIATLWRTAYWPTVIVVVTAALASLYHLGAPWNTRWLRDLPGAVLATALWLAGSGALRLYGSWILGSDSIYGPLAGPIVGLLWIWLTGFAVLLGAELNAQIEHLWPTRPSGGDADPGPLRRLTEAVTDRLP